VLSIGKEKKKEEKREKREKGKEGRSSRRSVEKIRPRGDREGGKTIVQKITDELSISSWFDFGPTVITRRATTRARLLLRGARGSLSLSLSLSL